LTKLKLSCKRCSNRVC